MNGQKRWIGNATFADIAVVFARNTQTNEINGWVFFWKLTKLACLLL